MAQVNAANILMVHRALRGQADAMQAALIEAAWLHDIPTCADDPVSKDAKLQFQPKISEILEIHTAHYNEVAEAAERLREAATEYGFTEAEVERSLRNQQVES
jgi:hypothetical protein